MVRLGVREEGNGRGRFREGAIQLDEGSRTDDVAHDLAQHEIAGGATVDESEMQSKMGRGPAR